MKPTTVALVLLLAGCGRQAWREADARLDSAATSAKAGGFIPMAGPHNTFGDFSAPGDVPWRVHLEAHQEYFIAAACTPGCDTLDFAIMEPHGTEASTDTSAGPEPRLMFMAPEEGDYRITFRHGGCSTGRCRWVAQLYQRRPTS